MADVTIRTEHTLGWRERVLLERLVRTMEKWTQTEVPAALSAEIDKLEAAAQAVKDAQPAP